ncbi:MAG TPA: hypothetical protein VFV98_06640 [Vicinamibacterales bacterium]|nr:hypothetical protein [Vicinamibacterales bacterium]
MRIDRHELDDGNLKRTADGELAMNAWPYYLAWQCGARQGAAAVDLRLWMRTDSTGARLTFESDAGAVGGRLVGGADVLARLLKSPLFTPVALMAISRASPSNHASGGVAFLQDGVHRTQR